MPELEAILVAFFAGMSGEMSGFFLNTGVITRSFCGG